MSHPFSSTDGFLEVVLENLSAPDPKVIRNLRPRRRDHQRALLFR